MPSRASLIIASGDMSCGAGSISLTANKTTTSRDEGVDWKLSRAIGKLGELSKSR